MLLCIHRGHAAWLRVAMLCVLSKGCPTGAHHLGYVLIRLYLTSLTFGCVLIRLYLTSFTLGCVLVGLYLTSLTLGCVLIRLYLTSFTLGCVLIRLYLTSFTLGWVLIRLYLTSFTLGCVLIRLYLTSFTLGCVLIRLYLLVSNRCGDCREYEGQVKMRYTVQAMRPVDFVAESKRMIDQLVKLRVKAEAS